MAGVKVAVGMVGMVGEEVAVAVAVTVRVEGVVAVGLGVLVGVDVGVAVGNQLIRTSIVRGTSVSVVRPSGRISDGSIV